MQWGIDALAIVNGEDKTDSIRSMKYNHGKFDIIFNTSAKVYSYNADHVKILDIKRRIDPNACICKVRGCTLTRVAQILDFGLFYRIIRENGFARTYRNFEVELVSNCLHDEKNRELFGYFKETANAISLTTDQGVNLLQLQYDRICAVEDSTVLANYLDPTSPIASRNDYHELIYPFGINQSQKEAVTNAFSSQVSIIQGPPGTGKTQTILNIIANAVWKGKTVAVVSNNNSATQNVAEKLQRQGLSFTAAFLGSRSNKEQFLITQTGTYPDMRGWILKKDTYRRLYAEISQLSKELDDMLEARNRVAQIEQELLALKPEWFYFQKYYESREKASLEPVRFAKLSSQQLLDLWLECEQNDGKRPGFFRRLKIRFRFCRAALSVFEQPPEKAIPFLQSLFYEAKHRELIAEKATLEERLRVYHFQSKMDILCAKSMRLLKAELSQRYRWQAPRKKFSMDDFRKQSHDFTAEYPVILSTTYSIKGTLGTEFVYDYLIVDEASQVDLATGVLAFSCAKNIVIVGDQKQLPNVLTPQEIRIADAIWNRHSFDERYCFSSHSLLASATQIWCNAPSVLLREHYRCHPKIAAFFNQKFYDGKLIVMTQDYGEKDVLSIYRTAPGNHAREHWNQRQIDVIREEILPELQKRGFIDIGVITPYREQVAKSQTQLGKVCDVATVHKFQGREKDAIILTTVDNQIGRFVDDPHMLNVAVSRAVRSLSVVISSDEANDKTHYGDLTRFIRYNNCQLIDSKIVSIFDLLYKGFQNQRRQFLKKHRIISQFDSENLAFAVIEKILRTPEFSKVGCVAHCSLSMLINDGSLLTPDEQKYAFNPLTHLDFLLFNKMDKSPVLVIEVDGVSYHVEGSVQAKRDAIKNSVLRKYGIPILRLRTNESSEEARIVSMLHTILS